MTIGKIFKAFLLALALSLLLTACTKTQSTNPNGALEDILSQIIADKEKDEEAEPFATLYRIVLPEDASPALYDKAYEFAKALSEATDTDTEVVYDYVEPVEIEGTFEILLGNTSRYYSENLLAYLRVDDYMCRKYRGGLVLGGIDDSATIAAIDRFCAEVLPEATKVVLLREEQEFFHSGEYEIKYAELNGFVLPVYKIVYRADGDLDEFYYARLLQQTILERSGYFLDLVPDNEHEGGKYISVGANPKNHFGDFRKDEAYVLFGDPSFLVFSDSKRGYEEIIPVFAEKLLETNEEGAAEHWYSAGILLSKKYFSREMIFSAVSDGGSEGVSIPKINALTDSFKSNEAGFSFASHMSPELMSRVLFGLSNMAAASESVDGQILSILYNDGYPIDVTVEKLRGCIILCGRISFGGGQTLLVFNGYYDSDGKPQWIADKIEEIADEEGLPFVAMITGASRNDSDIDLRCIDKDLDLYASDNISASLLSEKDIYGVEVKDFSIEIDF